MSTMLGIAGCLVPPEANLCVKQPHHGQTHERVSIVYNEHYTIRMGGLEKLHPHPQRYSRIYSQLVADGYVIPQDVFVPSEATREELLGAHSEKLLCDLNDPAKLAEFLEFPPLAGMTPQSCDSVILRPFRLQVGGTILAAEQACKTKGVAVNLGGGYHHANRDSGEGFNPYNDIAVAIRQVQKEKLASRVMVIDLDAHQGNGTAEIFQGDESVFTFSIHGAEIYPMPKSQSDLDVELQPSQQNDADYLATLRKYVPSLLEKFHPDLVILQGGADVLRGDRLTHFQLTHNGLVQRDAIVIDACMERNIPVAWVLGGGYNPTAWLAQVKSIERTCDKYGGGRVRPARPMNAHEKLYTK